MYVQIKDKESKLAFVKELDSNRTVLSKMFEKTKETAVFDFALKDSAKGMSELSSFLGVIDNFIKNRHLQLEMNGNYLHWQKKKKKQTEFKIQTLTENFKQQRLQKVGKGILLGGAAGALLGKMFEVTGLGEKMSDGVKDLGGKVIDGYKQMFNLSLSTINDKTNGQLAEKVVTSLAGLDFSHQSELSNIDNLQAVLTEITGSYDHQNLNCENIFQAGKLFEQLQAKGMIVNYNNAIVLQDGIDHAVVKVDFSNGETKFASLEKNGLVWRTEADFGQQEIQYFGQGVSWDLAKNLVKDKLGETFGIEEWQVGKYHNEEAVGNVLKQIGRTNQKNSVWGHLREVAEELEIPKEKTDNVIANLLGRREVNGYRVASLDNQEDLKEALAGYYNAKEGENAVALNNLKKIELAQTPEIQNIIPGRSYSQDDLKAVLNNLEGASKKNSLWWNFDKITKDLVGDKLSQKDINNVIANLLDNKRSA